MSSTKWTKRFQNTHIQCSVRREGPHTKSLLTFFLLLIIYLYILIQNSFISVVFTRAIRGGKLSIWHWGAKTKVILKWLLYSFSASNIWRSCHPTTYPWVCFIVFCHRIFGVGHFCQCRKMKIKEVRRKWSTLQINRIIREGNLRMT